MRCCIHARSSFWPASPALRHDRHRIRLHQGAYVIIAKRNPYDVLGVEPSVSNDELKSKHRRVVAENHPDKLIARG